MSYRKPKVSYWHEAPIARSQLVLIQTTLEDRIPNDHPVRFLDEILEKLDWTLWESAYDGRKGQPPIHPSVLCKVLLFAMTRRLRSSRQIEYEVEHSIDFIWLTSGRKLDHSTISEFRRKHADKIKDVYQQMIKLAITMGAAKLSELCIDGTKVLANASRHKTYKREEVEHLLATLDTQISKAMEDIEANDQLDTLFDDEQPANKLPSELQDLRTRQQKLQEVLAKLQAMEEQRRKDGIDNKKNPAQLPKNDLDSRILPNKEGGYAPNFTPMAVTETVGGFIVGTDVLIGNVEHVALFPMINDIQNTYEVKVEIAYADGTYSTGPNLFDAETQEIELLSPVRQEVTKNENPAIRDDLTRPVPQADLDRLPLNSSTKRFDRTAFVYDEKRDAYFCPEGKELPREGSEKVMIGGVETTRRIYRCHDCKDCPLVNRCRVNEDSKTGRKVAHDEYREVRDRQVERMQEPANKERYKKRQHIAETPFAAIKTNLGLRRFLLTGLNDVKTEWLWACTTFNLLKLMQINRGKEISAPKMS